MKPDKSSGEEKNYQPVMIRTLNQNEGKATRSQILDAIQKENPSRTIQDHSFRTVLKTLTGHKIVEQRGDLYYLLDYDTYTPNDKQWITIYCNEKIGEKSTIKLKNTKKIALCWPTDRGQEKIKTFSDFIEKNGKVLWGVNWNATRLQESDFPVKGYIYFKQNIIAVATISAISEHEQTKESDIKLRPIGLGYPGNFSHYIHITGLESLVPFPHTKLEMWDPEMQMPNVIQQRVYVKELTESESKYWIWSVTPENWKIVKQKRIWASRIVEKIRYRVTSGDKIIFYAIGTNEFQGIFEVSGDWYDAPSPIWADEIDSVIYISQVKLKPLKIGNVNVQQIAPKLKIFPNPEDQKLVSLVLKGANGYPSNNSKPIPYEDYLVISNLMQDVLVETEVGYWKISPGANGVDWENQRESGIIGIHFFDFGDLSKLSEDELREKIRQAYGDELTPAKQANTFGQMRDFMKIKERDIIVANSGKSRILGLGRVAGPYKYRPELQHPHTFPVDWYDVNESSISKQDGWMITVIPLSQEEFDNLMQYRTKYFLLRYNPTRKTPWGDVLGKSYHFGPTVQNYKKLAKGAKTIWFDTDSGNYHFWGYGDISNLEKKSDEHQYVIYDNFSFFNPPSNGSPSVDSVIPKQGDQYIREKIISVPNFNNQFSILPITKEIYDEIVDGKVSLNSFDNAKLVLPKQNLDQVKKEIQKQLLIPGELIEQIIISLYSGKHVILTGPVGTGKTHLAQLIPKVIWGNVGGYYPETVTATSEWTTQDVIGGIFPKVDGDEIKYIIQKGCVADTIAKNWQDGTGKSEKRQKFKHEGITYNGVWLVIDEFNRANIDRAFGPLFTALEYKKLKIPTTNPDKSFEELTIPEDYRIIGTLNTFDKHFLFKLSDALKRRFSFIEILPPTYDKILEELRFVAEKALNGFDDIKQELQIQTFDDLRKNPEVYSLLTTLYEIMAFVRMSKNLGTAVLISMFRFALISYTRTKNLDLSLDAGMVTQLLPHLESLQYWQIDSIMNFVGGRIHEMFRKFDVNKRPDMDRYEEELRNLTRYLRISGTNKAAGNWIAKFRTGEILKSTNPISELDPWGNKKRPNLQRFRAALESLKKEKGYFEDAEGLGE